MQAIYYSSILDYIFYINRLVFSVSSQNIGESANIGFNTHLISGNSLLLGINNSKASTLF